MSEQGLNNRGSVEFSRAGDNGLKTKVQMKISYELPEVLAPFGQVGGVRLDWAGTCILSFHSIPHSFSSVIDCTVFIFTVLSQARISQPGASCTLEI